MTRFIEHLTWHTIGPTSGSSTSTLSHTTTSAMMHLIGRQRHDPYAKPRLEQINGTVVWAPWWERSIQSSCESSICWRTRSILYSIEIKDSPKQHTGSWSPKILWMCKFSLGGLLCGTAKFRTPTTIIIIIIFKLVTKPTWWSSSSVSDAMQDCTWTWLLQNLRAERLTRYWWEVGWRTIGKSMVSRCYQDRGQGLPSSL